MTRRRLVVFGLAGIVLLELGMVLLVGASLALISTGACDEAGLTVDEPPGWELILDYQNDCQWTLVNAAGEPAPEDVYDLVDIGPPAPRLVDWRTTGYIMIALSLGGMVGVVVLSLEAS